VRIISGTHRGRTFAPPKAFKSRPTTDIAREALFNVLSNTYQMNGLTVIDLFAGSGGISFEFASRGAEAIIAVEKSYPVFRHLIKEVNELGFSTIHVLKKDVFNWLKNTDEQADIIFADPPFDHPRIQELPALVLESNKVKSGGCFILEHPEAQNYEMHKGYKETKSYGSVNFSFFFVD
jgi:16S rRNA (guanine(966)-N(2))-methyltransferase RsmD